ncbi:MAG: enoyl-CoA hydratase-related protein [Bernardetiaceae bacterium]|nr:enoyl-CoA hydratase-related protein [Bernardetiaceae bacterium]
MVFENLLLEIDQGVLTITLNRPEKRNALNHRTMSELEGAFHLAYHDQAVKAVIVTGAGDKAFVAGADIAEIAELDPHTGVAFAKKGQAIFAQIEHCPKPVIAAVNGFALGGGCELAMACHLRVATENASFGQPEVNLGILPGYGGTQRLTQLIGKGKALELMLTADLIPASQALALGLVNHVVPAADLLPKCHELLGKIMAKAPVAVAQVIKSVNAVFGTEGYQAEANGFSVCCQTADFKEGTQAFLEKRKANFQGH